MEHVRLGATGLQVSRVCLGMMSYGTPAWREWVLDIDAARPLVRAAVEAGITFFDTADMYSGGASEEVTGQLLRELFGHRDDYVLATRFVSMQDHYNLLYREEEREMHPLCLDQGVGVIPWSPLARGRLAGNRTRDERRTTRARTDTFADQWYSDADFAVVEAVGKVASERGLPPAQVALAWLLHQEAVTAPIVGATKPGHVEHAVAAVGVQLSEAEIAALEAPYVPHPVLGH